ncbi:2-amino-4-hydroxy-6-hydroxymethyldihydropteridine diphosphokinase [Tindallia californiensis]|uniref:2-amino-4-hydroxy-6-hydroxymethyldihydropteridine diphosphokinase n=1 Tax=Tindallia californiensis TaxID=159292 RepID=A0A1H3QHR2_9FIRM|nr:2-amino-4-hydroxy-6-hydroxymethyldihydropteridine diphosphokinase [Tindallia californiensis]SDZ12830.1 2-amino-4-hydroxy-6-hydroxymethyldihydropteridinediphosphokinase [Tindallia californiensis]
MNRTYLSLGSNIGDRRGHLRDACQMIQQHPQTIACQKSSLYETDPVGYLDQDTFLNMAVELDTTLEAYGLLAFCHEIEATLKRKRVIRWGPRSIDVDILLFNDQKSSEKELILPHPRMKERGFVILPLYELNPLLMIDGEPIETLYHHLKTEGIRKLDQGID